MDIKEIEQVVARIQGQLFKNSNSYSVGMLKSHFRGSGLQFKEHQIYCHGDDVRFIDWKLYAKSNTPYIKTFEEERNIEIIVFIDLSLSMFMGYRGLTKLQAAINIACLLALLVKQSNDYVQIVLLGAKEKILPRANGKKAIIQLVGELRRLEVIKDDGVVNLAYRPEDRISRKKIFNIINRFVRRKKDVVVLSDFSDLLEHKDLRQLDQSYHAHLFRIISPIDKVQKKGFNVYGFDASGDLARTPSVFAKARIVSANPTQKIFPAKVKTLDIEERYMERFVKELV